MAFIEVNNVEFAYPNGYKAVDKINFSINKGESVAILGQNGAGKTTAVKLLNGLYKPTSGNVVIDGKDTKNYTTAQISRMVGYVFQNPDDQIFNENVYNEIAFGPKNMKLSKEEIDNRVNFAATLCNVETLLEENPYNIPYSSRKFITLASVLAVNPDVIILDEPTAGQDKVGLDLISKIIKVLIEKGKTVLTITHDMEFAAENFERIIVMADKKVVLDSSKYEIFYDEDCLKLSNLEAPSSTKLAKELHISEKILTTDEFIENIVREIYDNK